MIYLTSGWLFIKHPQGVTVLSGQKHSQPPWNCTDSQASGWRANATLTGRCFWPLNNYRALRMGLRHLSRWHKHEQIKCWHWCCCIYVLNFQNSKRVWSFLRHSSTLFLRQGPSIAGTGQEVLLSWPKVPGIYLSASKCWGYNPDTRSTQLSFLLWVWDSMQALHQPTKLFHQDLDLVLGGKSCDWLLFSACSFSSYLMLFKQNNYLSQGTYSICLSISNMYITWEIILIQVLTLFPCLIPELKVNCIAQRIFDMNPEIFSVFCMPIV